MKVDRFRRLFSKNDRVMVAYSGGVDSTLLLYLLSKETEADVVAATVKTPYVPGWELEEAKSLCKSFDIEHITITLPIPDSVLNNPPERCYLCKKVLFSKILDYAAEAGCNIVADGTNSDDSKTHRPGMRALEELKVMSPLLIAGFTKSDIRSLLQEYDLEIWNKPAYACLLTRVPYNTYIDTGMLHTIELSEKYIHSIGFPGTRVRLHGEIARIECLPGSLDRMMAPEMRENIIKYLKSVGIKYITIDLEGYRSGSMDQ